MSNTVIIDNKEYNRDELSVEANQIIDQVALIQAELNKQQILLGAMELGARALTEQLSEEFLKLQAGEVTDEN